MRLLAVLLLCLFSMPALAASDSIKIERASTMSRPAELPTAGIFMLIINDGEADKLVGVKSSVTDKVMMHSMDINDKGVMSMKHEAFFDIPAKGTLALVPGNNHIMMLDLKEPFNTGTTLPLTLIFEKAGEKTIAVDVVTPDKLGKNFPSELLGEDLTEKMLQINENNGHETHEKSLMDAMRERIQNFFHEDKKMESPSAIDVAPEGGRVPVPQPVESVTPATASDAVPAQ